MKKSNHESTLGWRKPPAADATRELLALLKSCGPVRLRGVAGIRTVGHLVEQGATVACTCSAAVRSTSLQQYIRQVFQPTARRVHRGHGAASRVQDIVFCSVGFTALAASRHAEIKSMQVSEIDAAWDEVVGGRWAPGYSRPRFFADVVLVHAGKEGWRCIGVEEDGTDFKAAVRHLLNPVIHGSKDPSLATMTVDDLRWPAGVGPALFSMTALAAAGQDRFAACTSGGTSGLYDMLPCIDREMEDLQRADPPARLRALVPSLLAVVFVPFKCVPLPRCGVPLFQGIWPSVDDLADAVLGHVLACPYLREHVLILPSDLADMPHVPAVSGLDLITGRAFAFGDVARLLLQEVPTAGPKAGGRPRSSAPRPGLAGTLLARTCGPSPPLVQLAAAASRVRKQCDGWQEEQSARLGGPWRASGCGADSAFLPFVVPALTVVQSDKLQQPVQVPQSLGRTSATFPVNTAYVRAKYCSQLSAPASGSILNKLRTIAAFAVSRGLVEPWPFLFADAASDHQGCLGSLQLLTAFLRDDNSAAVLYALDGMVRTVPEKATLSFLNGTAPGVSDVVPCSQPVLPKVSHPGPAATDTGVSVEVYPYDPSAWGLDLWSAAPKPAAETADGEMDTVLPAPFPFVWFRFGARLGRHERLPCVSAEEIGFLGTLCPLLPRFVSLDDPGLSLFFAGTRYTVLDPDFVAVRQALGRTVAMSGVSPTPADVLVLLENYPPYMHARLAFQYHVLDQVARLKEAMDGAQPQMRYLEEQWVLHFMDPAAHRAPMDPDAYEALGNQPAHAVIRELDALSAPSHKDASGPPPSEEWQVFGRFQQAELDLAFPTLNLTPCPFTQRVVAALSSRRPAATVQVIEVVDARDGRIPMEKPPSHLTVPVVFRRATGQGAWVFVGGCDDAVAYMETTPSPGGPVVP